MILHCVSLVVECSGSEYMTAVSGTVTAENSQAVSEAEVPSNRPAAIDTVNVTDVSSGSQSMTPVGENISDANTATDDSPEVPPNRPVVDIMDVRDVASGCLKRSPRIKEINAKKLKMTAGNSSSTATVGNNRPMESTSNEAVVLNSASTSDGSPSSSPRIKRLNAKKVKMTAGNSSSTVTAGNNQPMESTDNEAVVMNPSEGCSSQENEEDRCLLNTSTGIL